MSREVITPTARARGATCTKCGGGNSWGGLEEPSSTAGPRAVCGSQREAGPCGPGTLSTRVRDEGTPLPAPGAERRLNGRAGKNHSHSATAHPSKPQGQTHTNILSLSPKLRGQTHSTRRALDGCPLGSRMALMFLNLKKSQSATERETRNEVIIPSHLTIPLPLPKLCCQDP